MTYTYTLTNSKTGESRPVTEKEAIEVIIDAYDHDMATVFEFGVPKVEEFDPAELDAQFVDGVFEVDHDTDIIREQIK